MNVKMLKDFSLYIELMSEPDNRLHIVGTDNHAVFLSVIKMFRLMCSSGDILIIERKVE